MDGSGGTGGAAAAAAAGAGWLLKRAGLSMQMICAQH
jgi:hypothetical protein